MNSKFYLLGIILFFVFGLYCQGLDTLKVRIYEGTDSSGLHQYQAVGLFPANNISEDYGLRSTKEFHGGLDFNNPGGGDSDLHDLLLSIEDTSTVVVENGVTQNSWSKWITLKGQHYYRYIHIFEKETFSLNNTYEFGGCLVTFRDNATNANTDWVVVSRVNGVYYAIGPTAGNVTFLDELGTQRTISVNTSVPRYSPIAGLGNSKNFVGAGHLHLEIIDSTHNNGTRIVPGDDPLARNPLRYIYYPRPNFFQVNLRDQNKNDNVQLKYGGDNTTDIRYRVELFEDANNDGSNDFSGSRYSEVIDHNHFEFLLKGLGGEFSHIIGEKDSLISLGGRYGEEKIPTSMMNNAGVNAQGNWSRTGYNSQAYWTAPWDDFYFADFVTRIHKDDPKDGDGTSLLANCPTDSRYIDGPYELKGRVLGIRTGFFESDIHTFNLDNFQPFVKAVAVNVGEETVYDMNWSCSSSSSCDGIQPQGGVVHTTVSQQDFLSPINIYVEASESMQTLFCNLEIDGNPVPQDHITTADISDDHRFVQYEVTMSTSIIDTTLSNHEFQLEFTGTDYPVSSDATPNQLLDLSNFFHPDLSAPDANCVEVPHRIGSGSQWSTTIPQGSDTTHHFKFDCFSPQENFTGNEVNRRNFVQIIDGTCCSDALLSLIETSSSINFNSPNCICEGQTSTPFTVEVNEDFGPFTYEWTGPDGYHSEVQNPSDISTSGEYILKITNELGCQFVLTQLLESCPGIESINLEVQPDCSGLGGNILTTVTGGALGFLDYQWINDQEPPSQYYTPDLYNVPAGLYSLTVTDQNGCTAIGEAEIEDLSDIPSFSVVADIQHACTPNTGEIRLQLSGGQEPYVTQWSYQGFDDELVISNVPAGIYRVTVTDANNCSVIEGFRIGGRPNVQAEITTATCFSTDDGSIELSILGAPISGITWSDGVTDVTDRIGLAAGEYSVTITTEDGCEYTPPAFNLNPEESIDTYPYLERVQIVAIGPGIQEIIYDAQWIPTSNGCLIYAGGTEDLTAAVLHEMSSENISLSVTASFSEAVSSGSVQYESSTGTSGIDIFGTLDNGEEHTLIIEEIDVRSMTLNGTFNMNLIYSAIDLYGNEIIDLNASSSDLMQCVEIPSIDPTICDWMPSLSTVNIGPDRVHSINVDCYPLEMVVVDNQSFCIQGVEGSLPTNLIRRIYWETPAGSAPSYLSYCFPISEELYGDYCANILLTTGCRVRLCGTYCERPQLTNAVQELEHPTCPGANDGSICLNFESTPPVVLDWGNGQYGNCIEGLDAGEYLVTMTVPGCDITKGFPKEVDFTLYGDDQSLTFNTNISPTCNTGNTGMACIYPQGGTPPYIFSWDEGITDNCRSNLASGDYPFTIVDDCGMVIQSSITIEEFDSGGLGFGYLDLHPLPCEPHLAFFVGGGFPGGLYTANIIHQETGTSFMLSSTGSFIFSNLIAGDYDVVIHDACGESLSIVLTTQQFQAEVPVVSIVEIGESCPEAPSGFLTINISGFGGPYSATLNNMYSGEVSGDNHIFRGLQGNTYTLTVVDVCGNAYESLLEVEIPNLSPIVVDASIKPTCSGESTGVIDLSIINPAGNSTFIYEWSNSSTGSSLQNLTAGNYLVTITGLPTGCEYTGSYNVEELEIMLESQVVLGESFHTVIGPMQDGFIELFFNESPGDLMFNWSNGASTNPIENLSSGTYSVTVSDDFGCSSVYSFEVPFCRYAGPSINLFETSVLTTNSPDGGSISLVVDHANDPLSYTWEGPNGFESTEQNLSNLIEDGEYCVTVTDACFNYDSFCFDLMGDCESNFGSFTGALLNSVNNCMDEESGESLLIFEGFKTYGSGIYDNEIWLLSWSTGDFGVVRLGAPDNIGGGTNWRVTELISGTDRIQPIMLPNGESSDSPYEVAWGTSRVFSITLTHPVSGCTIVASAEFSNNNASVFDRIHGCFPVSGLSSLFTGAEDMYITNGSSCLSCGFEQTGSNPPIRYCNESTSGLTLRYYPDDANNPDAQNECQKGGVLKLEGEAPSGWWPAWVPWGTSFVSFEVGTVLGNSTAIHFDDGGLANCGCLFPPGEVEFNTGIILPEDCLGTAFVFASDPSCDDDGTPGVGSGGGLEEFYNTLVYDGCDAVEVRFENEGGQCVSAYVICSEGEREDEVLAGPIETGTHDCRCSDIPCSGSNRTYRVTVCDEMEALGDCPTMIPGTIQQDNVTPLPDCDECLCEQLPGILTNCFGTGGDNNLSGGNRPEGQKNLSQIVGQKIAMQVFPNPTSQTFTVEVALLKNVSFNLQLSNLLGQTISESIIEGTKGKSTIEISFEDNVKSGVYLLTLKTADGEELVTKISLIH